MQKSNLSTKKHGKIINLKAQKSYASTFILIQSITELEKEKIFPVGNFIIFSLFFLIFLGYCRYYKRKKAKKTTKNDISLINNYDIKRNIEEIPFQNENLFQPS